MVQKKKSNLSRRYASSYEKRDGASVSKNAIINWSKHDGEVKFFSPEEGRNRINIIPYVIKSKNHPLVKKGEASVGELDYFLDYWSHRGVGPAEQSVICLKGTFGKPCPICEQQALLRKQGKEKEANALKASRRAIFNVEDLKEPGSVKVFETSHFLFAKELIEEARDDDNGGFVDFADPEEGKEVKFRAAKTKKGEMEFMEYKSFSFEDRDKPVKQKLLDSAISFDELLKVPTYEEVEKILYGDDDDEDSEDDYEEDDKPKKSKKSRKPEPEDEDNDEDEDDEKPSKKSKKSDDDEEDYADFDDSDDEEEPPKKSKSKKPADDDEDDEEDEEEKPKKSSKKSKKAEPDEDDESGLDDFDDLDDEEDEKPKKSKGGKSESESKKCPFGHVFGKDCENFDDCDDCDCWDKCVKASRN